MRVPALFRRIVPFKSSISSRSGNSQRLACSEDDALIPHPSPNPSQCQKYTTCQTGRIATDDSNTESKFLELPAELRNQIYDLVLVEAREIVSGATDILQTPGLLAASRQIWQETQSIYYQKNKFRISVANFDASLLMKWLQSSKHRANSNWCTTRLGRGNWDNFHAWLKATYDGKTNGRYPTASLDDSPSIVVATFELVMPMKKNEISWEEIERHLDSVRQILTASSPEWGWVKKKE